MIERGQEAVEIRITVITPVKLHAVPQRQPALTHFVRLFSGGIQAMQGRNACFAGELKGGIDQ